VGKNIENVIDIFNNTGQLKEFSFKETALKFLLSLIDGV
jgi:hypothetical protein